MNGQNYETLIAQSRSQMAVVALQCHTSEILENCIQSSRPLMLVAQIYKEDFFL